MFGQPRYARMTSIDLSSVDRRVQDLEKRLARLTSTAGRASSNISSNVSEATERLGDTLVSALADISDRFRGGARSVGDEAARLRRDAGRLSSEALDRLSTEVEQRPLVMLAIAAGIGLLIGLAAAHRR